MPENKIEDNKFLESGAVYIGGRLNKAGLQPIIVIDIHKFTELDCEIKDIEENLVLIFNYVVNEMMATGHVE